MNAYILALTATLVASLTPPLSREKSTPSPIYRRATEIAAEFQKIQAELPVLRLGLLRRLGLLKRASMPADSLNDGPDRMRLRELLRNSSNSAPSASKGDIIPIVVELMRSCEDLKIQIAVKQARIQALEAELKLLLRDYR